MYSTKPNEVLRAIKIESVIEKENATHIFGFQEFNMLDDYCYSPKGSPWFGKEIINTESETSVLNRFNDTMHFPLLPDSTWVFLETSTDTFVANLEFIDTTNVLGVSDSAYSFKLMKNDILLEETFTISKHYGVVQMPNISMFPEEIIDRDSLDYNFTAELIGIEKDSIGTLNLTTKDIYDYEIGDEFHTYAYKQTGNGNKGDYSSKKTIQKVMDKVANETSVTYTFELCTYIGINTIQATYYFNSITDIYPFQTVIEEYDATKSYQSDWKGIPAKYFPVPLIQINDSCYEDVLTWKNKQNKLPNYGGHYIKGLGGPYFAFSFIHNDEGNLLKYYKKGDTEWGTPYRCEDIVIGVNENLAFDDIEIYPNPAKDFITISAHYVETTLSVTLYSSNGMVLLNENFMQESTINIETLPKGVLHYVIRNKDGVIQKGSIIKQ